MGMERGGVLVVGGGRDIEGWGYRVLVMGVYVGWDMRYGWGCIGRGKRCGYKI